MIQSMTGFGAAEKDGYKVEMRSLNHRYLEISVRMPSLMAEHEIPVRNMIKERLARGKVDVTISLTDKRRYNLRVNSELAKGMYEAFSGLKEELSIPGSLEIDFFSGYRDLLVTEDPEVNADALYGAVRDALSRIEEMRGDEGAMLKQDLTERLAKLENIQAEIGGLAKEALNNYKDALSRKVSELASGISIDEARLAQEVALLAQKSDVTEELTRLGSHTRQFYAFLSNGEVIGRKLDFLMQEMNREVNTIGSKMDDIRILNYTIDMKTEMEKIREQVQNIQ